MVSDGGSHIGDLTTSHNDLAVNHGYSEDELFRLFPTGTFQLCDILIHIVICPESTGMPPATGVKIIRCQDTVWIVATSSDDVCELWGFPKKDCLFIFWMVYTIEFLRLFGSVFIRLTAAIFAASRIPLALDLMDLVTLLDFRNCCHICWQKERFQVLPRCCLTPRVARSFVDFKGLGMAWGGLRQKAWSFWHTLTQCWANFTQSYPGI
jgi:hypothetical protein